MLKRALLVLIAGGALAAAILFLTSGDPSYANLPPRAGSSWVAFGDSLTSGYGAKRGQDYPSLLAKRLERKIHNAGVAGSTSADGLSRLDAVLQLDPRVVLLCLGGNDALRSVPPDTTFSNLGQIIDALQQHGAFVVLIGVRSASLRDNYERKFRRLAREKKVLYVPNILDEILGTPSLMADQVHPNEGGYALIAERIEMELLPFLDQL